VGNPVSDAHDGQANHADAADGYGPPMPGPNLREYLSSVINEPLRTVTGKRNTVLAVGTSTVRVATEENPDGAEISLAFLQGVVDRVFEGEEVVLDPQRRSAFLAAVLLTLDGVEVLTNPRRARLTSEARRVLQPPGVHGWWDGEPGERFWMEITGRTDVGADLHAPLRDDAGHENWTYALVREVADGDVVFHYEKSKRAITSWSVATGGFWEEDTYWGTPRSTGPSGHPVTPYKRPGVWHGLHGPFPVDPPVELADLRSAEDQLRAVYEALGARHGGSSSLYFPVQFRRDGVRAQQGYLVKFPTEVVELFPQLSAVSNAAAPPAVPLAEATGELGAAYVPGDEQASQTEREPFPVDPAIVERGVRSHAVLQNMLAATVSAAGLDPRRPNATDPAWDLLWIAEDQSVWIAEVKSLTASNEERQLRLGLGQLLRYRHRLSSIGHNARAVLMVEYEPTDAGWRTLCDELGIVLLWPDTLSASALR
jgi:hypothetical protein